MKIDIFNHVMPTRYLELMKQYSKDAGMIKRMTGLRMLWASRRASRCSIREGIRSVEDLGLSESCRRKIYFENALRLLRMPPGQRRQKAVSG